MIWADAAKNTYLKLKTDPSQEKRYKAVKKAIIQLSKDPRYPGLQSQPYRSLYGTKGENVFESYAENNTPGAYRIFWYYGEQRNTIFIFLITPHP